MFRTLSIRLPLGWISFYLLLSFYPISSIADSKVCNVLNGEYYGDCSSVEADKRFEGSIIRNYREVSSIINTAHVGFGGTLKLTGICNGDITVDKGGKLVMSGVVNGTIINKGGFVEVSGQANVVMSISGETVIAGVVDRVSQSDGRVHYKSNAVVGGKRIK